MKRLVAGLIFAAGVVGGCVAHHFIVVPPATAQTPPGRWEYFCFDESSTEKIIEQANKAGRDGWEMVATDSHQTWCFKRGIR